MRWVRICALIAVVAFTAMADVARAQDGVFIDPGSPSGKEYEIPFESARRGAQPGTDPSAPITQGERSAVPFGEGITGDSPAGAGAGSRQGNGGAPGNRDQRGNDASASRAATSEIVEAAASNPGAPPSSTGSTLLYLGAGALVLALGAGIGMLLRRRRA
jgi:hypothetical protein